MIMTVCLWPVVKTTMVRGMITDCLTLSVNDKYHVGLYTYINLELDQFLIDMYMLT